MTTVALVINFIHFFVDFEIQITVCTRICMFALVVVLRLHYFDLITFAIQKFRTANLSIYVKGVFVYMSFSRRRKNAYSLT